MLEVKDLKNMREIWNEISWTLSSQKLKREVFYWFCFLNHLSFSLASDERFCTKSQSNRRFFIPDTQICDVRHPPQLVWNVVSWVERWLKPGMRASDSPVFRGFRKRKKKGGLKPNLDLIKFGTKPVWVSTQELESDL